MTEVKAPELTKEQKELKEKADKFQEAYKALAKEHGFEHMAYLDAGTAGIIPRIGIQVIKIEE